MKDIKLVTSILLLLITVFLGLGTVSAAPTITVALESDQPYEVHVGDQITIHVTIQNPDGVFYSNIQVLIPWPDGLKYEYHHGGGISNIQWDTASGIWYPGNMRPESRGQQKNLWIVGTVKPELENKTLRVTARYLQIYDQSVNVAPLLGTEASATPDRVTILPTNSVNLIAGFTATPTTGAPPLTVHFTDSSVGEVTSYAWDFNNDGIIDSTARNPTWTYNTLGTYTVKETVTGPGGNDKEIKTNYIKVSGDPENNDPDNGPGFPFIDTLGNSKFNGIISNLTGPSHKNTPILDLDKGNGGKAYEINNATGWNQPIHDNTLYVVLAVLAGATLVLAGYFKGMRNN